eukprot:gb/GECH01000561.1/.p1 GENE.gb/GECH01000561.1/~~gb/GECH01000561.1/.p1  ORF type:complete len:509 (+),score=92.31 gb/GECH01000561.1/:1-1527(+)
MGTEDSNSNSKWQKAIDPKSGRIYYFHIDTGEARWHIPSNGKDNSSPSSTATLPRIHVPAIEPTSNHNNPSSYPHQKNRSRPTTPRSAVTPSSRRNAADTSKKKGGGLFSGWSLRRRKNNKRSNTVFGVDLNEGRALPQAIIDVVQFLSEHGTSAEGIFRISGKKNAIADMKKDIESGNTVDFAATAQEHSIHSVAGLLKTYLRELPTPLMTYQHYSAFLSASRVPESRSRLECIRQVLGFLPTPNLMLLECLCLMLHNVQKNKSVNKMKAPNLAIVFAPTLLREPEQSSDPFEAMKNSEIINTLVATLIAEAPYLFGKASHPSGDDQSQVSMGEATSTQKSSPSCLSDVEGRSVEEVEKQIRRLTVQLQESTAPSEDLTSLQHEIEEAMKEQPGQDVWHEDTDVIYSILVFIPPQEVADTMTLVSRSWHRVVSDTSLWQYMYRLHWHPRLMPAVRPDDWRSFFLETYATNLKQDRFLRLVDDSNILKDREKLFELRNVTDQILNDTQ